MIEQSLEKIPQVESNPAPDAPKSPSRNFSFLHRNPDTLDAIEDDDGSTFVIPAQVGSTYWAILKVCYLHHDTPMRIDQIVTEAAEILEDRDPDKWDNFKNKKTVKTLKNGEVIQKEAQPWRKRLETNVKTLMRHSGKNAYGKRLKEKGHILRQEPGHFKSETAYVLRTDTCEPLPKDKK